MSFGTECAVSGCTESHTYVVNRIEYCLCKILRCEVVLAVTLQNYSGVKFSQLIIARHTFGNIVVKKLTPSKLFLLRIVIFECVLMKMPNLYATGFFIMVSKQQPRSTSA